MPHTPPTDLDLSIVVAVGPKNVIGRNGDMPWDLRQLPSDVRRFRTFTMNAGVVIMGMRTHESIMRTLGHPLRDRHSIVLTRRTRFEIDHLQTAGSIDEACDLVRHRRGRACVIGGGEVYSTFLSLASCIKMTRVEIPEAAGDTYFPMLDPLEWSCEQRLSAKRHDERDLYPTSYEAYKRAT